MKWRRKSRTEVALSYVDPIQRVIARLGEQTPQDRAEGWTANSPTTLPYPALHPIW
jgi:hypothetical protein